MLLRETISGETVGWIFARGEPIRLIPASLAILLLWDSLVTIWVPTPSPASWLKGGVDTDEERQEVSAREPSK